MVNLFQEAFDFQASLLSQAQRLEQEKKQLEMQMAQLVKENNELRAQVAKLENRPVPGQK